MKKKTCPIVEKAATHVKRFLRKNLPNNRTFHNLEHTCSVVNAAREISENIHLPDESREEILIAAWFHDCGHAFRMEAHEDISIDMARDFLTKQGFPSERIEKVLACIRATKMPHHPESLPEKVICDADLYHLSIPQYPNVLRKLRTEFESLSHKKYQDDEWNAINLSFLKHHRYFTRYGQSELESRKQRNIQRLQGF